jgi:hypothetical protein
MSRAPVNKPASLQPYVDELLMNAQMDYECSNCYRATRRGFFLTHLA